MPLKTFRVTAEPRRTSTTMSASYGSAVNQVHAHVSAFALENDGLLGGRQDALQVATLGMPSEMSTTTLSGSVRPPTAGAFLRFCSTSSSPAP